MENMIRFYVSNPTEEFEQIKDKINACLAQFNVEIDAKEQARNMRE